MTMRPTQLPSVCIRCRQSRNFSSSSSSKLQIGPEHPRYIEFPEPPQQTSQPRTRVKGILPVPRRLFEGKQGVWNTRAKSIAGATRGQQQDKEYDAGSYLSWKSKISEQRKNNLKDGLTELKRRHDASNTLLKERSRAKRRAREEAVNRPERHDEQMAASSNNFDLASLLRGEVSTEDRARELELSRQRYEQREAAKQRERLDHLHTLYTKAGSFIVNQEQLNNAVETAFGTDDDPVTFTKDYQSPMDTYSIWGKGRPYTIQDMLRQAVRNERGTDSRAAQEGQKALSTERVNKIAEVLTGGTL